MLDFLSQRYYSSKQGGMMIQIKQNNHVIQILLKGDLTKNSTFKDISGENKKIQIQNDGIEKWDMNFVAFLYARLKHIPKQSISTHHLPKDMDKLIKLAFQTQNKVLPEQEKKETFLERLGGKALYIRKRFQKGLNFVIKSVSGWGRQITGKAVYRSKDFWTALGDCGPKAILIVSLISFMVGLILAFVGALQLKTFGAQIYVASLVTIGMTRIMGAIMTGIIMAGRTGSSYAATIGTMQVNEELDALKTMGVSRTDFLVLPRINALLLSMPILVLISDIMGILGGCFVCVLFWDVPLSEYIKYTTSSFDIANFLVGLFHGVVFAVVIALCGCYFGLTCGRNADSVGKSTTNAVVYAIVWMIVMTGLITLACEGLGV